MTNVPPAPETDPSQLDRIDPHQPAYGYHVQDNVTGERASKDFSTREPAEHACRALNLQAGPGGRYGVYDHTGARA